MKDYIVKHWRGELDLGLSYWVNNVFLSFVMTLLTLLLTIFASNTSHLSWMLFLFIVWYLFIFFIFTPWVLVGLWQSTSTHIKKYNLYFWANVVRILVVVGIIRSGMVFVDTAYPQILGYYKLLVGESNIPQYVLSVEENNTVLNITGGMNLGLTRKVKEFVKQYPTLKTVKLESVGGLTSEARGVAKIVYDHHFNTFVSGNCFSSCTYIFASGKKRMLSTHGRLGFHRPAFDGVSEELTDKLIVKDRELLIKMGIDKGFINRIFRTPHADILEVSMEELKRVGMVTDVVVASNNFWFKSKEELGILLKYSGVSEEMLEKDITILMNKLYASTIKELPLKVDELTRWDKLIIEKSTFTYEYTILKNSQIKNLEHFRQRMSDNIKINLCDDLFSVYLLKHGVTILSIYRSEIEKKILVKEAVTECDKVKK